MIMVRVLFGLLVVAGLFLTDLYFSNERKQARIESQVMTIKGYQDANAEQQRTIAQQKEKIQEERKLFSDYSKRQLDAIDDLEGTLKAIEEGKAADESNWADQPVPMYAYCVLNKGAGLCNENRG